MASAKWRPFCLGLNVLTRYEMQYNNNKDDKLVKHQTPKDSPTPPLQVSYGVSHGSNLENM